MPAVMLKAIQKKTISIDNWCLFVPASASDQCKQEVVAALGVDELAADGSLVGMHLGDVLKPACGDA